MDWNATLQNVGIRRILVLLVFIVGPALTFPSSHFPGHPESEKDINTTADAGSASTAEVFRNIQTILSIAKPSAGKRKLLKQEAEASEGAANALAYLTDSFGGQLAGQILSLILSSVTGDVRGILGNSVNLFQTEESRDRVQLFLDDISQNFLKFTGLNLLVTTTKSPLSQPTAFPGQVVTLGSGAGQAQLQGIQSSQTIPISSLGSGSSVGAFAPASASYGGGGGLVSSSGSVSSSSSQQQQAATQQGTSAQQPIIYVLPQLGNGEAGSSGSSGSKTTGNKATASTNSGDDDSEEDRRLWSH